MSLLAIGVVLIVLVVLLWVAYSAPIPQPFKWAVMALLALLFCAWLLSQVGGLGGLRLH